MLLIKLLVSRKVPERLPTPGGAPSMARCSAGQAQAIVARLVGSSSPATAIEEWRRGSASQNRAGEAATALATATATGSGAAGRADRAEDLTGSAHATAPAVLRRPGPGSGAAGLSGNPGALAGTPECRRHRRPGLGALVPATW